MRPTLCLWFLSFLPLVLQAEDLSFKYIHEEYKKGNYETVARLTRKFLKTQSQNSDARFFFLYVSTEKDWNTLKQNLSPSPPVDWKESSFYWNGIYLFMERALVLGESDLLVKYGRLFLKEGKSSTRYLDAVFLLAYGLSDLKNPSEASKILNDLEKEKLPPKLQNQVSELRTEIKGLE